MLEVGKAAQLIGALRWPGGAECPRCRSRELTQTEQRDRVGIHYTCRSCHARFTCLSYTPLRRSRLLPLGGRLLLLDGVSRGWPAARIHRELEAEGMTVSYERVARIRLQVLRDSTCRAICARLSEQRTAAVARIETMLSRLQAWAAGRIRWNAVSEKMEGGNPSGRNVCKR